MGHPFVEFGERLAHMHDAEIIATVAYLLHVAELNTEEFSPEKHPYLERWRDTLSAYFVGSIDLELDALLDDVTRANFRKLAQVTRQKLLGEPETIEGPRLNAMAVSGLEFGDRPRAKMLADFDRLMSVVFENLDD